jgi:hypothetical protein
MSKTSFENHQLQSSAVTCSGKAIKQWLQRCDVCLTGQPYACSTIEASVMQGQCSCSSSSSACMQEYHCAPGMLLAVPQHHLLFVLPSAKAQHIH